MNLVTRDLPNDNYLWWIYGAGNTEWFWSRFQAGGVNQTGFIGDDLVPILRRE